MPSFWQNIINIISPPAPTAPTQPTGTVITPPPTTGTIPAPTAPTAPTGTAPAQGGPSVTVPKMGPVIQPITGGSGGGGTSNIPTYGRTISPAPTSNAPTTTITPTISPTPNINYRAGGTYPIAPTNYLGPNAVVPTSVIPMDSAVTISKTAAAGSFLGAMGQNIKSAFITGGNYVNPFSSFSLTTNIEAQRTISNPYYFGPQRTTINPSDLMQKPTITKAQLQGIYNITPNITTSTIGDKTITTFETRQVPGLGERQYYANVETAKNVALMAGSIISPEVGIGVSLMGLSKNIDILQSKTATTGEKVQAGIFSGLDIAGVGLFSRAAVLGARTRAIETGLKDLNEGITKLQFKGEYIKGDTNTIIAGRGYSEGYFGNIKQRIIEKQIVDPETKQIYSAGISTSTAEVNTLGWGNFKFQASELTSGKVAFREPGKSGYGTVLGGSTKIPLTQVSIETVPKMGIGDKTFVSAKLDISKEAMGLSPGKYSSIGGKSIESQGKVFGYSGKISKFTAKEITFGKGMESDITINKFGARIGKPNEFILNIREATGPSSKSGIITIQKGAKVGDFGNLGKIDSSIGGTTPIASTKTLTSTFKPSVVTSEVAGLNTKAITQTGISKMSKLSGASSTGLSLLPSIKGMTTSETKTMTTNINKLSPKIPAVTTIPKLATATTRDTTYGTFAIPNIATIPKQSTTQTTITLPYIPNVNTPTLSPIITTTGLPFGLPPIPRLSFDFGFGSRMFGAKSRRKYTPGYKELIFNIRGKAPKGTLTGLESRKITKGFKWSFN